MLQTDQNKLSMWRAVMAVLNKHKSIWNANTVFNAAYIQLGALILKMEAAGTGQQTLTTGITRDKDETE